MTGRGSVSLKLCAEEAASPGSKWTSAASQCRQGPCPGQVFSYSNRTKNPLPVLAIPGSFMEFPGSLHPLFGVYDQKFLFNQGGKSTLNKFKYDSSNVLNERAKKNK